jgi:hypothetical protein
MKLAFQRAALQFAVVLAMAPIGARAEGEPSMENPCEMTVLKQRCEIALDIDRDGRMNRAVLVRHPTGPSADLSIYLAAGDDKIDPARKPAISREDLASGAVMQLGASGRGSLTVGYGCGGCSDDVETTLTIVHRGGDFWVAGFTYDWETRDYGAGRCDINLLTGKGVKSRGLAKSKLINAKFTAVRLAEWSAEKHLKPAFEIDCVSFVAPDTGRQ